MARRARSWHKRCGAQARAVKTLQASAGMFFRVSPPQVLTPIVSSAKLAETRTVGMKSRRKALIATDATPNSAWVRHIVSHRTLVGVALGNE